MNEEFTNGIGENAARSQDNMNEIFMNLRH